MTKIKSQSGFTLMELMLVISIIAGLSIIEIQDAMLKAEQRAASQLGAEIHMVTSGVQKYVAWKSGTQSTLPPGPQDGVSWLFGAKCNTGTASRDNPDFISLCGFLQNPSGEYTTFGQLGITTSFTPDPGNNYLESFTVFDELKVQGEHRADLAGLAAMVANGVPSIEESGGSPQMASDVFVTYCIEGGRRDGIFSYCNGYDRQIIAVTSNSSASDRWLRTDNGNTMKNILEFDQTVTGTESATGFSLRQIKNVARLYNNNGTDPLMLGKGGRTPTMADVGIVSDANHEVLGQFKVTHGDIRVESDPATGSGGNIYADRDIEAGNNLEAGNDVIAGNDLNVKNNALVENDTTTRRIFDFDDPSFYLNPNEDSNLKDIVAETSIIPDMDSTKIKSIGSGIELEGRDRVDISTVAPNGTIQLDAGTIDMLRAKLRGDLDVSDLVVRTASGKKVRLIDALPRKSLRQTYVVDMSSNQRYVPHPDCRAKSAGGTTTSSGGPQIVVVPSYSGSHGREETHGAERGVVNTQWYVNVSGVANGWFVDIRSSYRDKSTGIGVAMTFCNWD